MATDEARESGSRKPVLDGTRLPRGRSLVTVPSSNRVLLVAPYFGRELRGRKERYAFAYAGHLAAAGMALEVATTTLVPDGSGLGPYPHGEDPHEAFPIYRFEASPGSKDPGERLVQHVRASADRYDAFLCVDVSASTTLRSLEEVAERVVLLPMLDDVPALHDAASAVSRARTILCGTLAEALLVSELFGSQARARTRVVGIGVDVVPPQDIDAARSLALAGGRDFVLWAGSERAASAPPGGIDVLALADIADADRAAAFSRAIAVAVSGAGLGFAPEVIEAWAYGKAVLAAEDAPGAAGLIRETGGGIIVPRGGWSDALATLPGGDTLAELARAGAGFVRTRGGWPRVTAQTREALAGSLTFEDGSTRDALLAQIAYLYPLVQSQRRTIAAIRQSRFWRLRDGWFALKKRFGVGPPVDPVQLVEDAPRSTELAALGDPYQLFRAQHRLRAEDIDRMRATANLLVDKVGFTVGIDARNRGVEDVLSTARSLSEQIYPNWTARIAIEGAAADAPAALRAFVAEDGRFSLVGAAERFATGDAVVNVEPRDRLEPSALYELALAFADGPDIAYSDEDTIDERGVYCDPWFKPEWAPETLAGRDYVSRLCAIRRTALEAVGGVRDAFGRAAWYDAALRVAENGGKPVHVSQVLYHRHVRNGGDNGDFRLAVEDATRRRGEAASISPVRTGLDVRYAVPGSERVCVIVPTRDRADLLGPCLNSLFERTAYANFEVIVVDNGSREPKTLALFEQWKQREPQRFSVLRDASPFNYSRLNNEAARATTAPFLVLLNNDTEVIAPEWMDAMLAQARRPVIGAVGALLLYSDDTVQHAGVIMGILGLAGHAHRYSSGTAAGYRGALELDTNYLAVTGACMMVEKRKFDEVGGLDETLAVSYNDVDLCLRLRHAGYRNVFVPRARLYHYESKSRGVDDTPAKVARAMEEVATIRKRWPEWSVRDPYYNPNLTVHAEDFSFAF